jgi:hypothetical protein
MRAAQSAERRVKREREREREREGESTKERDKERKRERASKGTFFSLSWTHKTQCSVGFGSQTTAMMLYFNSPKWVFKSVERNSFLLRFFIDTRCVGV